MPSDAASREYRCRFAEAGPVRSWVGSRMKMGLITDGRFIGSKVASGLACCLAWYFGPVFFSFFLC